MADSEMSAEDLREIVKALTPHLPQIERISRLTVKPSDVIVADVSAPMSNEMAARIAANLKQLWPDHRVAVMDQHVRLKVLESRGDPPPVLEGWDRYLDEHDLAQAQIEPARLAYFAGAAATMELVATVLAKVKDRASAAAVDRHDEQAAHLADVILAIFAEAEL